MARKSFGKIGFAAVAAAALAAALPGAASAQGSPLLLGSMFRDHAVIQRDRPIALWGRALPGEEVRLSFGARTARVRADRTGRWSAELPAMAAGGPYELTATTARGARQTARDVMVGDVWLCSGQSNMEYEVRNAMNAGSVMAGAGDNEMRLLTVGHDTSFVPLDEFQTPVRWQVATPASVGEFSAACYFMAREIRATQKVPVGLIDASWGGSAIDAWRSEQGIERGGGLADRLAVLRAYRTDPAAGNRRWGALWEDWWRGRSGDKPGTEPWQPASANTPDWKPVPRMVNWEAWGDPAMANFNGMVWYRTSFTLTPEQAAKGGTLNIGWADDLDQTWVNGQAVGNTNGPNASRSYAVPATLLKPGVNHVVVNVLDTWSNGGLMGPEELRALTLSDGTVVPIRTGWHYKAAPGAVGWPPRAPWESIAGLSTIYNGMIAPLGRYGLRGAAWYQGESDAGPTRGYAAKLAGMMADWRGQFGNPRLPFLVAQLAGWGPSPTAPVESGSATVRDEQRRAVMADSNSALAVTIDIGDRADIHPANKLDVGRRLARGARRIAYGERITTGPEVVDARRSGDTVTVRFAQVEGGLVTYSSDRAMAFELCGAEAASCRFVEGTVVGSQVTLPAGSGPATRVRFCWGDSPVCNLYDRAGLPAGPFEVAIAGVPVRPRPAT